MSAILVEPTADLRSSWNDARDEFGPGAHIDGSGLRDMDDVETAAGFAAWTAHLRRCADTSIAPTPGRVHSTYRWIVEDDTYLGAIDLRHELNDFLLEAGGHIGYSVRPSARRRGLATWALARTLDRARTMGIDRVLLTCDPDNTASAKTIERNGGQLEDTRDTILGPTRRYWIAF
ncbi:GNAT family N-acetyltransferase [Pseudokineococcus sp. 5B2Z-1]|uniref:GNAT family N-acetyltransferase n=1 Tax=Pseudokineococcus sp. 5B2Z-1 TaxID=3132744 RepID=UPI00309AE1BF